MCDTSCGTLTVFKEERATADRNYPVDSLINEDGRASIRALDDISEQLSARLVSRGTRAPDVKEQSSLSHFDRFGSS